MRIEGISSDELLTILFSLTLFVFVRSNLAQLKRQKSSLCQGKAGKQNLFSECIIQSGTGILGKPDECCYQESNLRPSCY